MAKVQPRAEWEKFSDPGFYDMWAVREVGDRNFQSPRLFHFMTEAEADQFLALLRVSFHAILNAGA